MNPNKVNAINVKPIKIEISQKKALSLNEVCEYISMGRSRTRSLMDEIHATRHVGSRVLFDRQTIDEYIDSLR